MASTKERARWERWYDQVTARMGRQKKSIERLVLITTKSVAALEEISGSDDYHTDCDCPTAAGFRKVAADALADIKEPAAATTEDAAQLEADTPVEDPRRN